MTNLEWLLSLPVEDIEKSYYGEECTLCIYDNSGECNKRSCVEGKLKYLNAEHKEKLKPCANCGGRAEFFPYKSFNNSDTGCIRCIDCGMRTSTGQKFEVIEIWNRRADDGEVDGDCQDRRNQIHDRV